MGKHVGRWVALAALAGAAAVGISYFAKYKSFHKELEEDFHDFEEGDEDGTESSFRESASKRKYVSLNSNKDEFMVAAKDMMSAAKDIVKDTSSIVSDTYRDMASIARDSAVTARDKMSAAKDRVHEKVSEKKDEWKEKFYTRKKSSEEADMEEVIDDLDEDFDFVNVADEENEDVEILSSITEALAQAPEKQSISDTAESKPDPISPEPIYKAVSEDGQNIASAIASSVELAQGEDVPLNERITATITEES
ncbi:hypothetical protein AALB16_05375 [Lachnospiraceae bacterium 62-35]